MPYAEITPVLLLIRFFELFAHIFLLNSIMHNKMSKIKYILTSIGGVALHLLSTQIVPDNYKFMSSFVVVIIVMKIATQINLYKIIIGCSITTVIVILLDMVGGIILLGMLNINKFEDIANSPRYYYLGMLMLSLLVIIVGLAIRYFKMTYTDAESGNKDLGIAFNSLLTLLFIFPSLGIIISYIENQPLSIQNIIITIISMSAILVLSIFNSQKRYNLLVSQQELECQKSYNTILQSLVDSLRTFKHDYNNTLATLYGYVQLNDMDSLKKMFKEILEESREISSLDKLNPNLIKDPNIFGLVAAKYQECIKKNVMMNFEIFADLEKIDIKIYDLTRILGIFLDNAIEAASGSKEKKLNLIINEEKGKIIIKITNTYTNKAISVEKMYEKGISSKGENRGLGLYKVKEIVKKYPSVKLETIADEKIFLQQLTIEKCMINN